MTVGDMMIPATPVPGMADPNPLVTLLDYQTITQDTTTTPETFAYFLEDALDQLQRKMSRTFGYAQYNERLFLNQNGQVYGSAVPYDSGKPVTNPEGATPPENVAIFQGFGMWVGWYIPLPSLPVWQGVVPPQTDISYWGGFVGPGSALVGERLIPAGLKRCIVKVIWYMANPALLSGLPGGTKSTAVGGVSVSGDLSSMVIADPSLRREIKRWRRPQPRAWAGQITRP